MTVALAERVLRNPLQFSADVWYQAMCVLMAERASA